MNSCRSTLIVDVYDVVPSQSPGGAAFHDVNGAKQSWLAVCILAVIIPRSKSMRSRPDNGKNVRRKRHSVP